MMEDELLHSILLARLELTKKKLDIALQGLKVISDGSDTYQVASKTLDEIDNMGEL